MHETFTIKEGVFHELQQKRIFLLSKGLKYVERDCTHEVAKTDHNFMNLLSEDEGMGNLYWSVYNHIWIASVRLVVSVSGRFTLRWDLEEDLWWGPILLVDPDLSEMPYTYKYFALVPNPLEPIP